MAEAKAAAAAAAADAKVSGGSSSSGKQYADSANSLLADQAPAPALQLMQPPAVDDEAAAAAAAEAAAHGIKFFANHHRTQSMDASSTSSLEAAALAAVQGSSAVTGDAVSAAAAMSARRGSSGDPSRPSSPRDSVRSGGSSSHPADLLSSEPSLAAMLGSGGASPTRGPPGDARGAVGSPVAVSRRLTDDLDAVSDAPSISGGDSSILGSPSGATDDADGLLGISSPSSVHFDSQGPAMPPPQAQQQESSQGRQDVQQLQQPRQQQQHQQPRDQQLQRQLSALQLPGNPGGKLPGAGTWIGGSGDSTNTSPIAVPARSAAGDMGRSSMSRPDTVSSSLDAALAGLRGVAPLVSVRLQVLNDTPLNSARSATGSAATESVDGSSPGYAVSYAERRRTSLEAASRAPPHQCDRSSWACKLGLCKLCNAKLATMGDEDDAPWLQPHVRVHFTVQGGVGECCCWRRAAAALAPPTAPPVYQHWVMLPDAPSGISF